MSDKNSNPTKTLTFAPHGKPAWLTTGLLNLPKRPWAMDMIELSMSNLLVENDHGGYVREDLAAFERHVASTCTDDDEGRAEAKQLCSAYSAEEPPLRYQGRFTIKYGAHDVFDIDRLAPQIVNNLGDDIVGFIRSGQMTLVNVDSNALPNGSDVQDLDRNGKPAIAFKTEPGKRGKRRRVIVDGRPVPYRTTDLELAKRGMVFDEALGYWRAARTKKDFKAIQERIVAKDQEPVEMEAPEIVRTRRIHEYRVDLDDLRFVVENKRRMDGSRLVWGKDNKHFAGLVIAEEQVSDTESRSVVVATCFGVFPDYDCEEEMHRAKNRHNRRKLEDQIKPGLLGKGRIFICGPLAHRVILGTVGRIETEVMPSWLGLNPTPMPRAGMPKRDERKPAAHSEGGATIGERQAAKEKSKKDKRERKAAKKLAAQAQTPADPPALPAETAPAVPAPATDAAPPAPVAPQENQTPLPV